MAGDDPRVMDIDRDGVIRIGERINFAQSEFKKKSKELETQLGNMHRDWMGEGGSAFGKLMIEWQGRQEKIATLLQQFEDSLDPDPEDLDGAGLHAGREHVRDEQEPQPVARRSATTRLDDQTEKERPSR